MSASFDSVVTGHRRDEYACQALAEVFFDDARVSHDRLIGDVGAALIAARLIDSDSATGALPALAAWTY